MCGKRADIRIAAMWRRVVADSALSHVPFFVCRHYQISTWVIGQAIRITSNQAESLFRRSTRDVVLKSSIAALVAEEAKALVPDSSQRADLTRECEVLTKTFNAAVAAILRCGSVDAVVPSDDSCLSDRVKKTIQAMLDRAVSSSAASLHS